MLIHLTPNKRPNNAGTLVIGQRYLELPPMKERVEATGTLTREMSVMLLPRGPVNFTKANNHMHYLGIHQMNVWNFHKNKTKCHTNPNNVFYVTWLWLISFGWLIFLGLIFFIRTKIMLITLCMLSIEVVWIGIKLDLNGFYWGFNVAVRIFQSYRDLEAGDTHFLKS